MFDPKIFTLYHQTNKRNSTTQSSQQNVIFQLLFRFTCSVHGLRRTTWDKEGVYFWLQNHQVQVLRDLKATLGNESQLRQLRHL